jgi:AsmA family/AsmA-like C-terminal region
MSRWVKWLLGAVGALAALVVIAAVLLPRLVDTPRIQGYIATSAAQALGRPVKFSAVTLRVLPLPAVALHDLEVADDPRFGSAPFLRLQTGHVRLKLLPLLTGRVELGDILLKNPVISLIQTADGRLNISTLGTATEPRGPARPGRPSSGSAAAGAAAVTRVLVEGGLVTYVVQGKAEAAQHRLSDVDLTLSGGATQIAFKGRAKLQPGAVSLTLSDGVIGVGAARSLTEASLRGKVGIDGSDVAPLAAVTIGPTPTVGGAVKGTLVLGGTVGAPTAAGEITMSPLAVTEVQPQCPEPKRRTLSIPTVKVNAAWQNERLTGSPLTATLGGTVTTQLTATLDRGIRVELADLTVKALPLEKVLVDYLCQGYAISGPLDLTGALAFEARDPMNTLSGPGQLRVGRGKVVGPQALALIGSVVRVGGAISSILAADLPPNVFDSPLEFESITGTYTLTNGVATTRDLLYTSRAMKVSIAGDYGLATRRMDLDMIVSHGRGQLQAKVTGTTTSPSIRVSPSTVLRDLDRQKTEQGIKDLLQRFGR